MSDVYTHDERFPYVVPLNNASLSEEDAIFAAEHIYKQNTETGATNSLHKYLERMWEVPYAASFMSGRASLYAIIQTLNLNAGDQILVPAFTCQAVANALSFHGVEAIFVDIELDTFGMDATFAKNAVTSRTKALLLQHTFGLVSRDTEALCSMAKDRGLYVIEDCAHATGGIYKGVPVGLLGDIAFFSSERSKVVNSIHGGWVITRDPTLGKKLKIVYEHTPEPDDGYIDRLFFTLYREWSKLPYSHHTFIPGISVNESNIYLQVVNQMEHAELCGLYTQHYKWRMPDRISSVLLLQLKKLPKILKRRRDGAKYWLGWADNNHIHHAAIIEGSEPVWLRFPILVDAHMKDNTGMLRSILGCEIGSWFATPIHPQSLVLPNCPHGMYACARCVNLPTWLPQ